MTTRISGNDVVLFPGVTRVTVVDDKYGCIFERHDVYSGGVQVHIQDDGKTLKIFPLHDKVG